MKLKLHYILILIGVFCSGLAEGGNYSLTSGRHYLNEMTIPLGHEFIVAEDYYEWGDANLPATTLVKSEARVGLYLDEYALTAIDPYLSNDGLEVEVEVEIKTQLEEGGPETTETRTLRIVYGANMTRSSDVMRIAGAGRISVNVLSQTLVTGTIIPPFLYVKAEVEAERYGVFNYADVSTQHNRVFDAEERSLLIYWDRNEFSWAESVDIEYTWIDRYTSDGMFDQSDFAGLKVNFRFDATRVNTKEDFYRVPLMYDKGYVVYRIRPVGHVQHPTTGEWVKASGQWSIGELGATVSLISISSANYFTIASSPTHNYQYAASFAEDGKRSDAVSYFDGSLKGRQQVSRNNETHQLVVGETIYDIEGRPAINVIPVPEDIPVSTGNTDILALPYIENLTQNESGDAFTKFDFDLTETANPREYQSPALGQESGAGRYYSPNNPNQLDENKYLPNGEGYVYTRTVFDYTGRVTKQSGLGVEHKLGSGHESKTVYSQPDQSNLDRLFGSDVGYAKHYKKIYQRDANQQWSVVYLDLAGNTIASALIGDAPDSDGDGNTNLDELAEAATATKPVIAKEIGCLDCEANNERIDNTRLEYSKTIFVPLDDTEYNFTYSIDPIDYFPTSDPTLNIPDELVNNQSACDAICLECVYDLEISITDEWGEYVELSVMSTGQTEPSLQTGPIITKIGSIQDVIDGNCNATNQEITIAKDFPSGSYTIIKKLVVNEEAIDEAVKYFFTSAEESCIYGQDKFITEYEASLENQALLLENCPLTEEERCDGFFESLSFAVEGSDPLQILDANDPVAYEVGLDNFNATAEHQIGLAEYTLLVEEVAEVCIDGFNVPNKCEAAYDMMLMDVSPGGQYGKTDESDPLWLYSAFNLANNTPNDPDFHSWKSVAPFSSTLYELQRTDPEGNENQWWYGNELGYASMVVVEVNDDVEKVLASGALVDFDRDDQLHISALAGDQFTPKLHKVVDGEEYHVFYANFDEGCRCYQLYSNDPTRDDFYEKHIATDGPADFLVTYPHNLVHVEDFLDVWEPSWADLLVKFHPEYELVAGCLDISEERDRFDSELLSTRTYDDALNHESITLTALATEGDVTDILNEDPYFVNNPSRKQKMENKLLNYYTNGGNTLNAKEFAAYTVRCGTQYNNTPSPTGLCSDFGSGDDELNNAEWEQYKSTYLSEKQRVIDRELLKDHFGVYVQTRWGGYFNDYDITFRYQFEQDLAEMGGFCGDDIVVAAQKMQEKAQIEHYINTLQCPRDQSVELLLDALIKESFHQNDDVEAVANYPQFTQELYDIADERYDFIHNVNTIGYREFNFVPLTNTGLEKEVSISHSGTQVGAFHYELDGTIPDYEFTSLISGLDFTISNMDLNVIDDIDLTSTSSSTPIVNTFDVVPSGFQGLIFTGTEDVLGITHYNFIAQQLFAITDPIDRTKTHAYFTQQVSGWTTYELGACSDVFSQQCVVTQEGEGIKVLLNTIAQYGSGFETSLTLEDVDNIDAFRDGIKPLLRQYFSRCGTASTDWDLAISFPVAGDIRVVVQEGGASLITIDMTYAPTEPTTPSPAMEEIKGFSCAEAGNQQGNQFHLAAQVLLTDGELKYYPYDVQVTRHATLDICSGFELNMTECGTPISQRCSNEYVKNTAALEGFFDFIVNPAQDQITEIHTGAQHQNPSSLLHGLAGNGSGAVPLANNVPFHTDLIDDLVYGKAWELDDVIIQETVYEGNYGLSAVMLNHEEGRFSGKVCGLLGGNSFCNASAPAGHIELTAELEENEELPDDFFKRIVTFGAIELVYDNEGSRPKDFRIRARYFDAAGLLQSVMMKGSTDTWELEECTDVISENLISNHTFDYSEVSGECPSNDYDNFTYFECSHPYNSPERWKNYQGSVTLAANTGEALHDEYNSGAAMIGAYSGNKEVFGHGVDFEFGKVYQLSFDLSHASTKMNHVGNCGFDYDDWNTREDPTVPVADLDKYELRIVLTDNNLVPAAYNDFTNNVYFQPTQDPNHRRQFITGENGSSGMRLFAERHLNWDRITVVFIPEDQGELEGTFSFENIVFQGFTSSSSTDACIDAHGFIIDNVRLVELPTPPQQLPNAHEEEIVDPCEANIGNLIAFNGYRRYTQLESALRRDLRQGYINHCVESLQDDNYREQFGYEYSDKEYHYTLYYYDRAGNLVQTVPPEGVHRLDETIEGTTYETLLNEVAIDRSNGITTEATLPAHEFQTKYYYNSLGQLRQQHVPDHTGDSYFWYDDLGRLIASQNAKQRAVLPTGTDWEVNPRYSYTVFDELSRTVEVGEMYNPEPNEGETGPSYFPEDYLTTVEKRDITHTFYEDRGGLLADFTQENLRNRIASVATYETVTGEIDPTIPYENATYYSYDVLGNVSDLVQDYPKLGVFGQDAQIKKMHYDYDLISGNVNEVVYQLGKSDQWIHRYKYDALNRLTTVHTSQDGVNWDRDGEYFYYDHGPLARTELGDMNVQGQDFAYTIHGWLKGVNSDLLIANNDIGDDAWSGKHRYVAGDEIGYTLGYYRDDYASIGAEEVKKARFDTKNAWTLNRDDLYNGNIKHMVTSIGQLQRDHNSAPIATTYRYDQLNRIKSSLEKKNQDDIMITKHWGNISNSADYYVTYEYDANGNIKHLDRKGYDIAGNGIEMDDLEYNYIPGTNKLKNVQDKTSVDQGFPGEIKRWTSADRDDNYVYDGIGNLVEDKKEGIIDISWTAYGKVKRVWKDNGDKISFEYDPTGNRIAKNVQANGNTTSTYYARDASGNPMATYNAFHDANGETYKLQDLSIYGSDRLGMVENPISVSPIEYTGDVEIGELRITEVMHDSKMATVNANSQGIVETFGTYVLLENNSNKVIDMTRVNLIWTIGQGTQNLVPFDGCPSLNPGEVMVVTSDPGLGGLNAGPDPSCGSTQKEDFLLVNGLDPSLANRSDIKWFWADNFELAPGWGRVYLRYQKQNGYTIVIDQLQWHPSHQAYALKAGNSSSTDPCDGVVHKCIKRVAYTPPNWQVTFTPSDWTIGDVSLTNRLTPVLPPGWVDYSGDKSYELKNHLGNVLAVVSDRKKATQSTTSFYGESFEDTDGASTDKALTGDKSWELASTTTNLESPKLSVQVYPGDVVTTGGWIYNDEPLTGNSGVRFKVRYNGTNLPGSTRNNPDGSGRWERIEQYPVTIPDLGDEDYFVVVYAEQRGADIGKTFYVDDLFISVERANGEGDFAFQADVKTYSNYYPFGWEQPGRTGSEEYRYGFNGAEKDEEIKGNSGFYNLGLRCYDPRLGRMFSIDPRASEYPWQSPYAYHGNSPISIVDILGGGGDDFHHTVKEGESVWGIAKSILGEDATNEQINALAKNILKWNYLNSESAKSIKAGDELAIKSPADILAEENRLLNNQLFLNMLNSTTFTQSLEHKLVQDEMSPKLQEMVAELEMVHRELSKIGKIHGELQEDIRTLEIVNSFTEMVIMEGAGMVYFEIKGMTVAVRSEKAWLHGFGADEATITSASNLKPKKGWFDVVIHGDPTYVGNAVNMGNGPMSAAELYGKMVAAGYKHGTKIRLVSCNANSGMFAQNLANIAEAQVIAPSSKTLVDGLGKLITKDGSKYQVLMPE